MNIVLTNLGKAYAEDVLSELYEIEAKVYDMLDANEKQVASMLKKIAEFLKESKGEKMSEKIVQTAGRDQLGEFAPEFAHFNDDVLFGENWNNEDINLKTRSIITIVALMSSGITDSSLIYHLQNAKKMVLQKKRWWQLLHM